MIQRKKNKPSIGIIGRGSFSKLLKKILKPYASEINLIGRDSSQQERDVVLKSDIVILGITLDAYPKVLEELRAKLKPETLLVDVCSVKVVPAKLIKEHLPNHKNLLLSHPLFGPQSAKKSTTNLKFIISESSGARAKELVYFCQNKLKLSIIDMTAEDHDRAMAYTHALTFFVSQSLHPFKLEEHGITTPSFNELLDLSNIAKNESEELLRSIHKNNPYAKEVRDKFADQVIGLKKELDK